MSEAGYSKRSLSAKLGLKEDMSALFVSAPEELFSALDPLPDPLAITSLMLTDRADATPERLDYAQIFSVSREDLEPWLGPLKRAIFPAGMVWICWPKKASRVPTDLTDNVVRTLGLNSGLVDVKVAAIDQTWSGLKFVYRRADRK